MEEHAAKPNFSVLPNNCFLIQQLNSVILLPSIERNTYALMQLLLFTIKIFPR